MSAPVAALTGGGLLEKLMATVRVEFRVEVFVPDPHEPVLGVAECLADGCDRSVSQNRLCSAHARRWRAAGVGDVHEFAADSGPALTGRGQPSQCTVTGCQYGVNAVGLCMRHYGQWKRAGRPDSATWAAAAPAVSSSAPHRQCRLPFCSSWVENDERMFCRCHTTRWRQLGSPDIDEFLQHCLLRGKARVDFRGLAPQLGLEFRYAMQRRRDQQVIMTPPQMVSWAMRRALNAGVSSLLELTSQQWRQQTATVSAWPSAAAFLLFARDEVETLRDGIGWEVEYPREVWRLHKLPGITTSPGRSHPRNNLRFDRIGQSWLRGLVKRWIRLRLTSGLSVTAVLADLAALTRFSAFLTQTGDTVGDLTGIDRALLERYLAWIPAQPGGHTLKEDCVTAVGTFFTAIRQHGWDDTLPTTAVFFPGDIPPRPPRMSRRLAEYVMAQVEAPENLARWSNPDGRLVTLILMRCGLRATDACTLPFDCVMHDGQGAPYLRYLNNKMRREAAVPIDEELEAEIRAQQQRVTTRWPGEHPHLFPQEKGNSNGCDPLSYYSYRAMLNQWLTACDIRDEHGEPAHLTPHQWRHTFACRLINRDVPQEVIRVLLDHSSNEMTSHYARITDQTVRRRWEQAVKVNVNGQPVAIAPDGPLAQAQWAKTRYGIATQTLPHGYCGLPVQKSCPHANACLTCPVFITGPEFLPELREHRGRTLTLLDKATVAGHTRVIEMNQQVLTNLDRMIAGVQDEQNDAGHAG
ncbi:tyrosine-type recombinase/integrase [Rathayibacter soli]|uniref:tyrosine-type recombinase/integrase n=1 Tax=Rathayibacter soli TaxID=3144168 RepID=UPI0027E4A55C|nr:tyrosine-type recombinase/integrase [Glaciibacter superstes]